MAPSKAAGQNHVVFTRLRIKFQEIRVDHPRAAGHITSRLISIRRLHREDKESSTTQTHSILEVFECHKIRHIILPAFADSVTFTDNEWVQVRYIYRLPSRKPESFLVRRSRSGGWPAGMALEPELEDVNFEEGFLQDHFSGG